MKTKIFVRLLAVTIFISALNSLTSCSVSVSPRRTTVVNKPLPPGQAKKVYGDKSAKNYTKKRRR